MKKEKRSFPYVEFRTESSRKLINRIDENGKEVKEEIEEPETFRLYLADNIGTTCHVKKESIANIKQTTGARVIDYANFPDRSDYNDLRAYLETECKFELDYARRERAEKLATEGAVESNSKGSPSKKYLGAQAQAGRHASDL